MFERCIYMWRKKEFFGKLQRGLEAGFDFSEMLMSKERFIMYLAKREKDFEKSEFYFGLAKEIHRYRVDFVGEYYGSRRNRNY